MSEVTVTYVSDGVTTSAANTTTPYAEDTINKYIRYQRSLNSSLCTKQDIITKTRIYLSKKEIKK